MTPPCVPDPSVGAGWTGRALVMATETMQNPNAFPAVAVREEYLGFQELWQVPAFLLGVVAVLACWLARPLWYDPELRALERGLAQVRGSIELSHMPTEDAIALAKQLLADNRRFSERNGEIHFLLGSAYLRLGRETAGAPAREAWQQACRHFAEAETLDVPAGDRVSLMYRHGVSLYLTGADRARVIDYLSRSVEHVADDRAEGYGMLAQAYLSLPTPDVQAALKSNEKQLALPVVNDALLAPARLLRGELLLKVGQRAEARKMLARIGANSAPVIYARSRYLLARCYQEDKAWEEAARLWEEVLADRKYGPANAGEVLYDLGICYRRLERTDDAAQVWETAVQSAGDAGRAAALRLADLRAEEGDREAALALFNQALQDVKRPEEYQNTLIPLSEARALLEAACRAYRDAGDFEGGRQMAQTYARLAAPGLAELVIAQLTEALARVELDRAAKAGDPQAEAARARYREAGAGYAAAAELQTDGIQQAAWLRRAAECYLQGRDPEKAIPVLERFVRLTLPADKLPPEQLGEAWYRLAEAHQALGHEDTADMSYRKCIEYPSPYAFRARHHLALREIAQTHLDQAEEILKQNLDLMRLNPDPETQEKSLYALAGLLYRRQNYRMAVLRLQEALESYPANPEALLARYQLALSYRYLSAQESDILKQGDAITPEARAHYLKQSRLWLEKAVATSQALTDELLGRERAGKLKDQEKLLLRDGLFVVADSHLYLGHYEEAARTYEVLARRLHGQVEELFALRDLFRCHLMSYQPEPARSTLQRVRGALDRLEDTAFQAYPMEGRAFWENWYGGQVERLKNL